MEAATGGKLAARGEAGSLCCSCWSARVAALRFPSNPPTVPGSERDTEATAGPDRAVHHQVSPIYVTRRVGAEEGGDGGGGRGFYRASKRFGGRNGPPHQVRCMFGSRPAALASLHRSRVRSLVEPPAPKVMSM